jgi:histidyl-tRNA synthetase
MDLQWVKGTSDYLPETQLLRERLLRTIRETFERFGFDPLETPVLNYYELLSSKYAGGAEILKETLRLTDLGERELCLRYDLTVPFSLLIGMHQGSDFPLPFKRYEIGKIFRDGPVKKGRRVEFTQCDADVAGVKSVVADAELIAIAGQVFGELGLEAYAEVNHRKLLSGLILEAGVPEEQVGPTILAVDKLKKIGRAGVLAELKERGIDEACDARLFELLGGAEEGVKEPLKLLDQLEQTVTLELAREGVAELRELFEALQAMDVQMRLEFTPTLARGLEIYTGPVFEFFLEDQSTISSSLAGGGRYDRIIGQFLYPDKPERAEEFPATGISFGLEPLTIALQEKVLKETASPPKTGVQVLVAPLDTLPQSLSAASQMRAAGLRVEVAHYHRKLKKALNYANRMNIPFVIIIGSEEVEKGVVVMRDMIRSTQDTLPLEDAIAKIK